VTPARRSPRAGADGASRGRAANPRAKRPRGRPARLSRGQIIDAALAMLEREPHDPPTLARIAAEVDAVPAALYRHFENLDELLDCVLARVLEASPSELDEAAAWPEQLADWMHDLRGHLLQYPAILRMIDRAGRTSPAWLEASSALIGILERAGLAGHDLAASYLWILETTVGLVMQEAALPLPDQLANARAARDEFSDTTRERFAKIVPAIEHLDAERFFAFVVEQTTAAVALRAEVARER